LEVLLGLRDVDDVNTQGVGEDCETDKHPKLKP
jgi:hypothetical protein